MSMSMFILWFPLIVVVSGESLVENKTLYIGAFYPLTNAFANWGQGCKPAADLALQHINMRPDILPGHRLEFVTMDTQVL